MQQLSNLITMFKNKLFRIPDYQRGYAWQVRQLKDFWEDLMALEADKNHYTGVLMLEEVNKNIWNKWSDDTWLIDNKGYSPFYIVDGQQRLTTCIILIQAILEVTKTLSKGSPGIDEIELCDTKISEIRNAFIFQERKGGLSRSYIFGYEKDNPSYEFLKTHIFCEVSSSNQSVETLYTHNLENAKKFFMDNMMALRPEKNRLQEVEKLYKKVTRHILFNEYVIQNDVDVFVAFETTNNRGKKLSDLELLKNRLIYLSTLFKVDDAEKDELRKRVNDGWKEIYHQLGRSKENPLNDDDFLRAHWIMYFKYSRKKGDDYISDLLSDVFTPKKVLGPVSTVTVEEAPEVRDKLTEDESLDIEAEENDDEMYDSNLTVKEISVYAASLQSSVQHWYNSFNPIKNSDLTAEEQNWLDRLNRVGISYFRPLVMSSYANPKVTPAERVNLFKMIERFIFVAFRLPSQVKANYRSSQFYNASRELYYGKKSVQEIIDALKYRLQFVFDEDGSYKTAVFEDFINTRFKDGKKEGFYGWRGLRYFLYEYELSLFNESKTSTQKITWDKFINQDDMVTIEHILPQTPDKAWKAEFGGYTKGQLNALTNSLGNLLALSQPKNSSLQNDAYSKKRSDKDSKKGYFNGSYSENRLANLYDTWNAENIKKRGMELLGFMEKRWDIKLGNDETKKRILYLDFLNN